MCVCVNVAFFAGFTRLGHVLHCVLCDVEISCIVNGKFITYVFTITKNHVIYVIILVQRSYWVYPG